MFACELLLWYFLVIVARLMYCLQLSSFFFALVSVCSVVKRELVAYILEWKAIASDFFCIVARDIAEPRF